MRFLRNLVFICGLVYMRFSKLDIRTVKDVPGKLSPELNDRICCFLPLHPAGIETILVEVESQVQYVLDKVGVHFRFGLTEIATVFVKILFY